MSTDEELVRYGPVLRIGRAKKLHRPRVLIEQAYESGPQQVVIRTRCGLDPLGEGFVETHGFVTCDECGGY